LGPEGGRPGRPTQAVRQQTRSYYILPKATTRPTLSYTGHMMK